MRAARAAAVCGIRRLKLIEIGGPIARCGDCQIDVTSVWVLYQRLVMFIEPVVGADCG